MISFVELTQGSWAPLGSRVYVKEEMIEVGSDMVKMDIGEKNRQRGLWIGLEMVRKKMYLLNVLTLPVPCGADYRETFPFFKAVLLKTDTY